jgi:hypothetical protein
MLGGANVITKAGDGTILALLFGGLNVVTQVGNGSMYLLMLGMGNVATKIGDGNVIEYYHYQLALGYWRRHTLPSQYCHCFV